MDAITRDRERLIRLCARLSGSAEAAEDLAQETLIEAWRHEANLRDPGRREQWLSGIARNVCRRWLRRQGHERSRGPRALGDGVGEIPDDVDLELELERAELAELLDSALALLPPDTRSVLVQRFIEDSPHAEIAERLGMTEGAVAVRVHRGKAMLRRLLTTELSASASAWGLLPGGEHIWQETRMWCPLCGRSRMVARFDHAIQEFAVRCPHCTTNSGIYISHAKGIDILTGVKAYRPALKRLRTWAHQYYGAALSSGRTPCINCGRPARLLRGVPDGITLPPWASLGVQVRCDRCPTTVCWTSLTGLVLSLPQSGRFWSEHRRMETTVRTTVGSDGRELIEAQLRSLTDTAELDLLLAADTLEVLDRRP